MMVSNETHDHAALFALPTAQLLVRIIHHEVEEHVESPENTRDLSAALEVQEQTAVHEL